MPKCPNCGRETARTMDWACQWCGYPLLSRSYKKIPKTYKQLKSELQPKPNPEPKLAPAPEPESVTEPEPEAIAEPEPELEPISEPEPIPEPEPELKPTLEPEFETAPNVIETTVEELHSAYRDKFLADAKFTNKILKVTGPVDKIIVNDIHEIYYIILTSAEEREEWHIRCTFDKAYGPELNRLTTGQMVTVQGKYDGYRINILIRDCVLVP